MLNAYFFCFFRSFLKLTAYLYLKEQRRRCLYAAVKRTAAVTVIAAAGNTSMQGKL